MSGSEVPDELMKVAREVLRGVKCADDAGWADVAADIIARALAAERERATLAERSACAGIAQDPYRYLPSGEFCEESVVIRAIEAAILARP